MLPSTARTKEGGGVFAGRKSYTHNQENKIICWLLFLNFAVMVMMLLLLFVIVVLLNAVFLPSKTILCLLYNKCNMKLFTMSTHSKRLWVWMGVKTVPVMMMSKKTLN